ncbi:hypothetical protein ACQUET_13260, partial [Lactococcus lactis]|uniref:hypothetical protein n=1 Tax=Lactococcus lactis TaxID=1358 RepID=UPI003D1409E3
ENQLQEVGSLFQGDALTAEQGRIGDLFNARLTAALGSASGSQLAQIVQYMDTVIAQATADKQDHAGEDQIRKAAQDQLN